MEGQRKRQPRAVRRCYQCCRQEAQILVLAYEQVYPQARRVLPVRRANEKASSDERRSATSLVRRA